MGKLKGKKASAKWNRFAPFALSVTLTVKTVLRAQISLDPLLISIYPANGWTRAAQRF